MAAFHRLRQGLVEPLLGPVRIAGHGRLGRRPRERHPQKGPAAFEFRKGFAHLVLVRAQQGRDATGALGHPRLDVLAQQRRQHGRGAAGADGGHYLAAVDHRRGGEVAEPWVVDHIDRNSGRTCSLGGAFAKGLVRTGDEGEAGAAIGGGVQRFLPGQADHLGRRTFEQAGLGLGALALASDHDQASSQGKEGGESVHGPKASGLRLRGH